MNSRAKFRKEWIGRLKNSPKVKFMARNFTTAKDAGRYNVAISCAWREIPNRFPDRALRFHCKIRTQMLASITRHKSLVLLTVNEELSSKIIENILKRCLY